MKLFLFLFPIYILVLAGIPCRADDECCVDEIIMSTSRPLPGKTNKRPDYPVPCSPFFACGACHGFVVPHPGLPVPEKQPDQPVQQAVYKSQSLPGFHASIWQPPKSLPA